MARAQVLDDCFEEVTTVDEEVEEAAGWQQIKLREI
jgi:hypothetical protein